MGEEAVWREGKFTDGQINNLALFRPDTNIDAVVYLHREIECARAMELPISLGSDDSLTVWLNGQKTPRGEHRPRLRSGSKSCGPQTESRQEQSAPEDWPGLGRMGVLLPDQGRHSQDGILEFRRRVRGSRSWLTRSRRRRQGRHADRLRCQWRWPAGFPVRSRFGTAGTEHGERLCRGERLRHRLSRRQGRPRFRRFRQRWPSRSVRAAARWLQAVPQRRQGPLLATSRTKAV